MRNMQDTRDIREIVFAGIDRTFEAELICEEAGILAGITEAAEKAREIGLEVVSALSEGAIIAGGSRAMTVRGLPVQIAKGEDCLIGMVAKCSGIATAAASFNRAAEGRIRIVSGAWKKMPIEMKALVRKGLAVGGASLRMVDEDMLYLDKNYIAMLGGIENTLQAVAASERLKTLRKVIQIKGREHDIAAEAETALAGGADVIFVDTGSFKDLEAVTAALSQYENAPKIAYSGSVSLEDIEYLKQTGIHAVDVGRKIIDAPLLDMRFEVKEL